LNTWLSFRSALPSKVAQFSVGGNTYRVSRFVGRHRLGVGLSTAALMAILGMAVLAEHQRRAAERERDIATRQRANAEAVAQFMEEQLGQTDEAGRPTDPLARVDRAQRRAEQLFFDTPEVLVPLQDMLSNLNFALGREEAGRRNLQAIAAMAPKLTDPVSRALALCLGRSLEPQAADALARVDRALQALPTDEGSRHVRSQCLSERSAALHEAGRYAEALRDIEAAHEVAPLLMRRMREMAYWRGKGLLLNEMGQPHASDQAYARVVELMHAAGRAPSVRLAQDLIWRAITHWRMGRPREGLRFAEQATAAASGTDGASSVPFITMIHARLQLETGQLDDARRLLESVMLRNGRLVPPYPRYWDFVAPAHRLRGEHAAAIAVLERDLREHRDSGYAVRNAINAIALAQELLAAREADRALAVLRDVEGNPALQTFRWEAAWARAQALNLATGRAAEAEAAARAAVTVAAQRSPPQGRSALHGHAHLELARALAAQGRDAETRAAAERAAAELEDALGPQHSATRAAMVLARR
jgi:tetratricopeptide (TPR) repeat protein